MLFEASVNTMITVMRSVMFQCALTCMCVSCNHMSCVHCKVCIVAVSSSAHSVDSSGIMMHPAVWPQYKFAENWGGGSAPFLERGAGSPSNTKSPGLRPTSMPSAILIHSAIWP